MTTNSSTFTGNADSRESEPSSGRVAQGRLRLCKPLDVRNAWRAWVAYILGLVALVCHPDFHRTVTSSYRTASAHWYAGQRLYENESFLYLPQSAAAFLPFTQLPFSAGEAAWRVFTVGSLALAVALLAREGRRSFGYSTFSLLTILTIPLTLSAARNGQTTLPLAAAMITFGIALGHRRFWTAALLACIGLTCKPYMLVPMLLAMALSRPFAVRMLPVFTGFLLLPFTMQPASVVVESYLSFAEMLRARSTIPWDETTFSDLFALLNTAGWPAPSETQLILRIGAALMTLALMYWIRRAFCWSRTAVLLYPVSAIYLMLFSPGTENNTYAMMGPAIAWLTVELWRSRTPSVGWLLAGLLAVMTVQRPVSMLLLDAPPLWMLPLGTLLVGGAFLWHIRRGMLRSAAQLSAPERDHPGRGHRRRQPDETVDIGL